MGAGRREDYCGLSRLFLQILPKWDPASYTDTVLRVQGRYLRDARRHIRRSAEISIRHLLVGRTAPRTFQGPLSSTSWNREGEELFRERSGNPDENSFLNRTVSPVRIMALAFRFYCHLLSHAIA
jgi:hypothetical protein